MTESIEHNASIVGRILVPYYKSILVKIHITEKDRYSLKEQSVTLIEQSGTAISIIDLFTEMHFDKQMFIVNYNYLPI